VISQWPETVPARPKGFRMRPHAHHRAANPTAEHPRARRVAVSAVAACVALAGSVLGQVPAQAGDGLTIASVDVTSPAKGTGVVTGEVAVDAPSGARLTYSVAPPAKGSATISSTGTLTYTPTPAARHRAAKDGAKATDRTDRIRVTVTDAAGHRAVTTVRVPILGANRRPVLRVLVGKPDPRTGVVTGRITVSDPDGDPLTWRVASDTTVVTYKQRVSSEGPRPRSLSVQTLVTQTLVAQAPAPSMVCPSSTGSVTVNPATGAFTYTPTAPNPSTGVVPGAVTDTYNVTVNDGYGGSIQAPVIIPSTGTG